jgi:hypothetical protein
MLPMRRESIRPPVTILTLAPGGAGDGTDAHVSELHQRISWDSDIRGHLGHQTAAPGAPRETLVSPVQAERDSAGAGILARLEQFGRAGGTITAD